MAARQDETTRMQQELLSSVVQIADDLRMCGYDSEPNSGTKYGFNSTSNSTNVICTKDDSFSFNGTIIWYRFNDINNTIEYQNAAGNWVETATNVSNIVFAYFNNQGNSINATFPESIRAVDITVTAVASPERSLLNIGNRTLSTRVYCRNTGL